MQGNGPDRARSLRPTDSPTIAPKATRRPRPKQSSNTGSTAPPNDDDARSVVSTLTTVSAERSYVLSLDEEGWRIRVHAKGSDLAIVNLDETAQLNLEGRAVRPRRAPESQPDRPCRRRRAASRLAANDQARLRRRARSPRERRRRPSARSVPCSYLPWLTSGNVGGRRISRAERPVTPSAPTTCDIRARVRLDRRRGREGHDRRCLAASGRRAVDRSCSVVFA